MPPAVANADTDRSVGRDRGCDHGVPEDLAAVELVRCLHPQVVTGAAADKWHTGARYRVCPTNYLLLISGEVTLPHPTAHTRAAVRQLTAGRFKVPFWMLNMALSGAGSRAMVRVKTQARAAGHTVETVVLPLDQVPRALVARDTRGLIKLVADAATDRLLGGKLRHEGLFALLAVEHLVQLVGRLGLRPEHVARVRVTVEPFALQHRADLRSAQAVGQRAGAVGHAVATIFGVDPKHAMDDDLVRLKTLLEAGKTTAEGKQVTKRDVSR